MGRVTLRAAYVILATAIALAACSRSPHGGDSTAAATAGAQADSTDVTLPRKNIIQLDNDSIRLTGHWVLSSSEPRIGTGDLPFAAQPLNSTLIECLASTRVCVEHRAQIVQATDFDGRSQGFLLPMEPASFSVVSWDREYIVAKWTAPAEVECLLRIARGSEEVEMEFRREPSEGRKRVLERWVLE